ncbi:PHD and RING finger domain-containing protein 1-like isoform X2 [Chironomus tepperi]|uniref:PHD and RING finger domain-containing protein 1-like isoform X2 n=1 Tax=Chironomus tepperi TaxID=113505 RepID=UPI00391F2E99
MSESEKLNRSLTPCLDENRVEDENCGDTSKEIELSDISDDDEEWSECNNKSDDIRTNGNGDQSKEFAFKKITRNNRERNYRDVRRRTDGNDYYSNRSNMSRFDNSRRKEIERYDVRKVIANREFSISRSRSRSFSPPRVEIPSRQPKHSSYSPKRDIYKQSLSPVSRQKRYSPISPRHSSSPDQYRAFPYNRRSLTPEEATRRSRSKHRHTKTRSIDKTLKRRKHKSKDHQRKHKKSRSKSKRQSSPSLSPEPVLRSNHISPSRQIMNVTNPNLQHQENIRIILKNEDFIKRQKIKKRDKKSKKDKSSRKETREKISQKTSKEHQPQKKEVFASGDNIVISVCFNNNNNNSTGSNNNNNNVISKDSNNDHTKLKSDIVSEDKLSTKPKSKKRQASPAGSIGSNDSFDKTERRQRKHKHNKKVKSRRERGERNQSKEPHTPPMNPPSNAAKRKNDAKPIAIIDLEKSPGKEVTQSPKEVIILSDSDGENKKRDGGNKDIVIIEDTILEKGISIRNHSSPLREHHTPPESPPPPITQPGLKFSIKTKSNILPFNLLHDQAEEIEDLQNVNNVNVNTVEQQNIIKQQEVINNTNEEKNTNNNLNEAYDPFEPTKSGSTSPVTPPPPNEVHSNDINKNSNKLEGLNEKIQLIGSKDSNQIPGIEEHQANQQPTSSLWNRKEFDKKSSQPLTPPMPPTFAFSSSNASNNKPHISALYDGIYGSDLKTPVVPSPIKTSIKPSQMDKSNDDDDDMTPYSPSSDGYGGSNNDYEPPPQTSIHQSKNSFDNIKHSDTQSSEPSASYSFGNDDTPSKTTPLKLTASTLKSFNSTMRTGSLQYVNKAELSIFENYLPASQQKSPLVKRQPNSSFLRTKMSRFTSSMNENGSPHRNISFADSLKPPVIDETMLDDDVPSSAVDLANKDRFLKKSLRIERVAEEVKLVLKPHYNKKHITKEEYKEILRKAVPKICHNKTGEINIQKITQLIEAYIKKVRYKRKSTIASSI